MHYGIVWAAKAINCTALLAAVIFKWAKSVMFYENKVCRSVGLHSLPECWDVLVECRGKPGKWRSSFLNIRDRTKLYCLSKLACEVLACLRPV